MPRKPGRPKPAARPARRVRPRRRPVPREEPLVVQARLAAAGEALRVLSGPSIAPYGVTLGRRIHELTDRSIEEVHTLCQDHDQVACQVGCTYCCRFPVAVSVPEVLAIAAFVRERFDEGKRRALDARVAAHFAATDGMDMDRRDRIRPDCPFLEVGRCSVYEVRPVACRGYSSYDVDSCQEDCDQPGTGVEIPTNDLREQVYGAIREGIAVGSRMASVEHRLLELSRAYAAIASDPTLLTTWSSRPGAWEAVTGERVFPGRWSDELAQEFEEVYRETVARLDRVEVQDDHLDRGRRP